MSTISSAALAQALGADSAFARTSRSFRGIISLRSPEREWARVAVDRSRVSPADTADPRDPIILTATANGWQQLKLNGAFQRAFRHGQIEVSGDRIDAMMHWKMLAALGDVVAARL